MCLIILYHLFGEGYLRAHKIIPSNIDERFFIYQTRGRQYRRIVFIRALLPDINKISHVRYSCYLLELLQLPASLNSLARAQL